MSTIQPENQETNAFKIGVNRGGRAVFLRRFEVTIRKLDTQSIREDAVNMLLDLAKEAYSKAKPKKGRDMEEALNWARITAYIYQTINSITREYDAREVKEVLTELREMIKRELGKGNGEDQARPGEDKSPEEKGGPTEEQG